MGDVFEQGFEKEFAIKCEEIAMYQPTVRYTLDGEWSAEELAEDVQDECLKFKDKITQKYAHRALHDRKLLIVEQVAEKIIADNDLIDRYNEAVAKDNSNTFGIVKFDNWLHNEINKISRENLVDGR